MALGHVVERDDGSKLILDIKTMCDGNCRNCTTHRASKLHEFTREQGPLHRQWRSIKHWRSDDVAEFSASSAHLRELLAKLCLRTNLLERVSQRLAHVPYRLEAMVRAFHLVRLIQNALVLQRSQNIPRNCNLRFDRCPLDTEDWAADARDTRKNLFELQYCLLGLKSRMTRKTCRKPGLRGSQTSARPSLAIFS